MKLFLFLLGILIVCQVAVAGSDGFANSENEIYHELTIKRPKNRGLTRGLNFDSGQSRGIKVIVDGSVGQEYKTINFKEKERQNNVNLKIEFDYDSSKIRQESYRLLNDLGRVLLREDIIEKKIFINVHTDSIGSEEYNFKLSLERARSVRNFLINKHNINSERLVIFGYGESFPIKPNISNFNRSINRRVEICVN